MKKVLSTALLTLATLCLLAPAALAAGAEALDAAGADNRFTAYAFLAIGSGIGMGIAALGGALAQGKAASAALEGIARNPGAADKLFTPMLLGLAFVESLVIFTFVIAFLLMNLIKFVPLPVG